jgi:hypothetical protein
MAACALARSLCCRPALQPSVMDAAARSVIVHCGLRVPTSATGRLQVRPAMCLSPVRKPLARDLLRTASPAPATRAHSCMT